MARFAPSVTNEPDSIAKAMVKVREEAIGRIWPFPRRGGGRAPFARMLRYCGVYVPRGHAALLAPCLRDKIGSARFKIPVLQNTRPPMREDLFGNYCGDV